jgi:DHA1 family multidrug resistance protein-like MFS transporter
VPIFFYHRGARIRAGSKFAPCLDLKMRERVEREEKEQEAEREKSVVKIDV